MYEILVCSSGELRYEYAAEADLKWTMENYVASKCQVIRIRMVKDNGGESFLEYIRRIG